MAGESHDSVGHGLTTIIALTQGFADSVEIKEQLWLQAAHAQRARHRDPRQDNLSFIVSMEAIEHAPARLRPEHHVLSRDYEQDGTLRIRIHDDGHGGWAWASLGRSGTDHS